MSEHLLVVERPGRRRRARLTRWLIAVPAVLVALALAAVGVQAFLDSQWFQDRWHARQFEPTPAVSALRSDLLLTDAGRLVFDATAPELLEAAAYNQACPRQEPDTALLGCYDQDRVYVYDITQPELAGMNQVTAAHELLHAVWHRLGDDERARLTTLLTADYERLATDDLRTRMDYYERAEPGQFANELHSILGTEFADLDPELEAHYAEWLGDRSAIVAYSQASTQVFRDLEAQIADTEASLAAQGQQIDADRAAFQAADAQLGSDITAFNAWASSGDPGITAEAFYARRSALVSRSDALKAQLDDLNARIVAYNDQREQYLALIDKYNFFNSKLDSMAEVTQESQVPTA